MGGGNLLDPSATLVRISPESDRNFQNLVLLNVVLFVLNWPVLFINPSPQFSNFLFLFLLCININYTHTLASP
ncbi:hypothetical protein QVD17_11157 [Tagetes erecta]|uniref:Uncharacterized protein n=1 Tax=Tagetes erecta TaxID=13708 RepID=A0AAD8P5F8_TARER|nr:hypothetical protein QVD17_11157 [Tagetes erecta]